MMEKITTVNQIEILESGRVQIQLAKRIVDDGQILSSGWHRTAVEPGDSVADQMIAVNTHLESMGWAAVAAKDIARVENIVAFVHTPEVVAAYRAEISKREEASGVAPVSA